MNKTYQYILLAAGLLACSGLAIYAGWFFLKPRPIIIQGEVDAKHINVSLKIPGRIANLYVRKGDRVKKGQLLATLESPEIQAKLSQAKAAGRAAAAQREKADSGAREEEISAARSNWQRALVATELAEKTYTRTARLYTDGVVSAQKHDEAKAQFQAAQKQSDAAQAVYNMVVKGTRREDKTAAAAIAVQAAGVVSEVNAYYRETMITAPLDGEVVDILAEQGEMISAGFPVVRILDVNDVWVVFHIRENMLAGLRIGDSLTVDIPALREKGVTLKVTYISALGDFATWKATQATGDFDLKTFEIHARPNRPLPALRPGMSVVTSYDKSNKHPRREDPR